MKALYLKSLVAAALAVTLSSCEKKAEEITTVSEKTTTKTSSAVYPLIGTDMSNNILPKKELPRGVVTKESWRPKIKVKLIDTVCSEYLEATKKLDFSGLKEGKYVTRFGNSDLTINTDPDFIRRGVVKLSNGPKGWWTHWNYSPYTQSEHPEVLFAKDRNGYTVNSIDLAFSNEVKFFGFEIAPNVLGKDVKIVVQYKEWSTYRAPTMFQVEQTISSPSGARLIAVKSEKPFAMVMITLASGQDIKDSGLAISNIRYAF
jgi:hypothetical protein